MDKENHGGVRGMPIFLAIALLFLSSCAHVIPQETLREVNPGITFAELRTNPRAYEGELVLLGGILVKTVNRKEGTLLEVYQTEISRRGKPKKLDESEGRFLALYEGFLDSAIFREGREVTIAVIVKGEQTMRLGEIDYRYPYLLVKDIYLWQEERPGMYAPYPWGWWHPWRDPYWCYR
jgi:outer membrane lipoprotein